MNTPLKATGLSISCQKTKSSSAVAERPRDAACLSVVSFNSTISRAQSFIVTSASALPMRPMKFRSSSVQRTRQRLWDKQDSLMRDGLRDKRTSTVTAINHSTVETVNDSPPSKPTFSTNPSYLSTSSTPDCLHDHGTGPDLLCFSIYFLFVFSFNFSVCSVWWTKLATGQLHTAR